MSDKPSVWVIAFGFAGLSSCIYGLVMALVAPAALYGLPIVFVFCYFGVLAQPLEMVVGSFERIHESKLTIAKYKAEAESIFTNRATDSKASPIIENELNDLQREKQALEARLTAWRGFYVLVARNAKQFGGLGWRKAFETVMDDVADWRTAVKEPLIRAELAIAVNYGANQSATWREGINADVVLGWLVSNLPPLPEGMPPNMRDASQTHSENKPKQGPTGQTSD